MENLLGPEIVPDKSGNSCITFNYKRFPCSGSDKVNRDELCKRCINFYEYQLLKGRDLGFDPKKFFLSERCRQGHAHRNTGLTLRYKSSRRCLFCHLVKLKTLPDNYVKGLLRQQLKIPRNLIPQKLVNLKRQHIRYSRKLKQLNQEART